MPAVPIAPQRLRLVARQRGRERLRKLLAGVKRIGKFRAQRVSLRLRDRARHQTGRPAGDRPVEYGEVELIVHEHLITQPQPISAMQLRGETAPASVGGTWIVRASIVRTSFGPHLSD